VNPARVLTKRQRLEAIRAAGKGCIAAHMRGDAKEVDRLIKEERRLIEEFRRDYPHLDMSRYGLV
jgi:type III secretion system FlhB-like substrate exporter